MRKPGALQEMCILVVSMLFCERKSICNTFSLTDYTDISFINRLQYLKILINHKTMKKTKTWSTKNTKALQAIPSASEKKELEDFFAPLVESFKKTYIKTERNPYIEVYTIDIYTKWYRNSFYFCELSKSESPYRIKDEFESKFLKLQYVSKNQFDFYYFRHTGQWFLVAHSIPMEDCQAMILTNPVYHPLP
jgi:hypothetical protein